MNSHWLKLAAPGWRRSPQGASWGRCYWELWRCWPLYRCKGTVGNIYYWGASPGEYARIPVLDVFVCSYFALIFCFKMWRVPSLVGCYSVALDGPGLERVLPCEVSWLVQNRDGNISNLASLEFFIALFLNKLKMESCCFWCTLWAL